MELEPSLPLNGEIYVSDVVGAGNEADDAGDEEDEALDAGHGGDAVGHDAPQYQSWNKYQGDQDPSTSVRLSVDLNEGMNDRIHLPLLPSKHRDPDSVRGLFCNYW